MADTPTPKSRPGKHPSGRTSGRTGDFAALTEVVRASTVGPESIERRRRMLADLCILLGQRVRSPADLPDRSPRGSEMLAVQSGGGDWRGKKPVELPSLPPRTRQVLDLLLKGRSEKGVAKALVMSIHTAHVHVKAIYKRLGVSTRAELLALCLSRGAQE